MISFRPNNPDQPEWEINESNAHQIFWDIIRHDDDKVIGDLVDLVLEEGSTHLQMIFYWELEKAIENIADRFVQLQSLKPFEPVSELQERSVIDTLKFYVSIQRNVLAEVEDVINQN